MATAVMSVVDRKLHDTDYEKGAYGGDYTIHRFPDARDPAALHIIAAFHDGSGVREVLITHGELRMEIVDTARDALEASQPKPVSPTIGISADAIKKRRDGYRRAMAGNGKPIDLLDGAAQIARRHSMLHQ